MITRHRHLLVAFFATVVINALFACTPSLAMGKDWQGPVPHSDQSIFDMVSQQEVLEMTLEAELDSLILNRNTEAYREASFTYKDDKGVKHTYGAKVRPRGKFRRMVCEFPPLKLKFSKKELEAAGLSQWNEMKLVTHCLDDQVVSRDLILREYLAYKLYNELTPNSFRVQLVKVTYKDTKDSKYKLVRYGFLIEDSEELAARTGGVVCDHCLGKPVEDFNASQEKISSLFQYLIGNTDWNLETNRNVELLAIGGKLVPVPYDFDFSAVVSAPYARLNGDLGQKTLTQRFYLGLSKSTKELYASFSYFRSKKYDLYRIVEDFRMLEEETRDAIIQYLDTFYSAIESEESAERNMFGKGL